MVRLKSTDLSLKRRLMLTAAQYKTVHCARHGDRREAFVCYHLVDGRIWDFSLPMIAGTLIRMPGAPGVSRFR